MFSIYRPITCLDMMWKILTAHIKKKFITRLNAVDSFRKKRKVAAKEKDQQMNYYI